MKRYFPLIANLTAAVIFSFTLLFTKVAMEAVDYDIIKFLALRFAIGILAMSLLWVTGLQKVNFKGKPLRMILIAGLTSPLISQVVESHAIANSPTSQMAVLSSLFPILLVIGSVFVNKEYPTRRQVAFMLVSVAGVALISLVGGQMEGGSALGVLLIVCNLLMGTVYNLLIRRSSRYFSPFETIYVTTAIGAVGFSAMTVVEHIARGDLGGFFDGLWTPAFIVSILYMGIGSTVIAFLLRTYAVGNLPMAVSSSTGMLGTVIAILVGVFLLDEVFRPVDVVGTVIILAGIIGMSLSYNTSDPGNRFADLPEERPAPDDGQDTVHVDLPEGRPSPDDRESTAEKEEPL